MKGIHHEGHEGKTHFSLKESEKWGARFISLAKRFEVEVGEVHVSFGEDVDRENALAGG
jgi:hypothetical protein